MKFFKLTDDMNVRGRWHLSEPLLRLTPDGTTKEASFLFQSGRMLPPTSLRIPVNVRGNALDFTLTNFALPVVSAAMKSALEPFLDDTVQVLPAAIDGYDGDYFALNIRSTHECLDESASQFIKWMPGDGRPDKLGQYRMVVKLVVREASVPRDCHLFRIKGWILPIIVSDAVATRIRSARLVGPVLTSVSV